MLPFLLVFISIFVFQLLGVLSNKYREERNPFMIALIEVAIFVIAAHLFMYLFNADEIFLLFIALIIYVESRVDALKNLMEGE